ncbi:MAG: hypothetical protein BMS9Abin02_0541 [Anaerolineae bacterium]|nr:MAG: hypothetical protein BMS9Abin02_0541 [Anaerolineae bacterium]
MFEEGGEYSNRIGRYKVIKLGDSKMTVEYKDGSTAELSINIQRRIWENILVEEEARSSLATRKARRSKSLKNRFYIKPILVLAAEEVINPGRQGKVEATIDSVTRINPGDRLIYYAVDSQVFFAVVTITGPAKKTKSTLSSKSEVIFQFPMDVDVFAPNLKNAVHVSTVDLESQKDIQVTLSNSAEFVEISEDDFELMAELLTELAEEEEDLDDTSEEEEEYDD